MKLSEEHLKQLDEQEAVKHGNYETIFEEIPYPITEEIPDSNVS